MPAEDVSAPHAIQVILASPVPDGRGEQPERTRPFHGL
jgi:hypothetical protein